MTPYGPLAIVPSSHVQRHIRRTKGRFIQLMSKAVGAEDRDARAQAAMAFACSYHDRMNKLDQLLNSRTAFCSADMSRAA